MGDYYAKILSAERLALCYQIASPRVKQYLNAEIEFSKRFIRAQNRILELGCGYGRILSEFHRTARFAVGIDTSLDSLNWGKGHRNDLLFVAMDATCLGFPNGLFDCVFCLQNGLSAFKIKTENLLRECFRVTRPGGLIVCSSYSEQFWNERLEWFRKQSDHGLIGEIDEQLTGNSRIVCKDGFIASTIRPEVMFALASGIGVQMSIEEVDNSSIFYIMQVE